MTDGLPPALRAAVWGIAMAGTGTLLGAAVDRVAARAMVDVEQPAVKVLAQFAGGILTLGQVMQSLVPAEANSPLGDGLLMYFFYFQQQQLFWNMNTIIGDIFDKSLPYPLPPPPSN